MTTADAIVLAGVVSLYINDFVQESDYNKLLDTTNALL